MKKSRIALIVCVIAVLALVCSGGVLLYLSLTAPPTMIGFVVWEYDDVLNQDEPYTTVILTEEIHKEYPELATLIYGKPGYEIGVTNSPLNLILYPDQYITEERAYELWNAFGYDTAYFSYNPSSAEERHVLSENGKLYCLIETSV